MLTVVSGHCLGVPAFAPDCAQIGRVIRHLRRARKLTIEDLADKADMHHTYLSGIERGHENPSLEKLSNLAYVLQTQLSKILADAEDNH